MRKKIILACSICKQRNYTSTKNARTNPERVEVNKFCKTCNEHTLHRETK
ncbi:50S ribosomal protein L33 [Scopulibacillus darangshiensis]|nr:50S ribosomal protein L33 [Scopulibacillus darangshiensis]